MGLRDRRGRGRESNGQCSESRVEVKREQIECGHAGSWCYPVTVLSPVYLPGVGRRLG